MDDDRVPERVFSFSLTTYHTSRLWIARPILTDHDQVWWFLLQKNSCWGGWDKVGETFYSWELPIAEGAAARDMLVQDGWRLDNMR